MIIIIIPIKLLPVSRSCHNTLQSCKTRLGPWLALPPTEVWLWVWQTVLSPSQPVWSECAWPGFLRCTCDVLTGQKFGPDDEKVEESEMSHKLMAIWLVLCCWCCFGRLWNFGRFDLAEESRPLDGRSLPLPMSRLWSHTHFYHQEPEMLSSERRGSQNLKAECLRGMAAC